MSHTGFCLRMSLVAAALVLLVGTKAQATSQNWDGGTSIYWTNNVNWSSDTTYPSAGDTATFNAVPSGNRTNINIAGLSRIKYITFDTYNAGTYQLGALPANSQTLVMENDGNYRVTASAANSQVINAAIQVGTDRAGANYNFQNDSAAYALTLAGDIRTPSSGGTAGTKTLLINGVGNVRFLGNILTNGFCPITLDNNNSGTLTLTGSNHITRINFDGAPSSVVDIGGGYLYIDNLGSTALYATQNGVINGTGKLRLSTSTGHNYAENYVAPGKTLVINPEITGATGFEMWSGTGTFVFNGINTFESNVIFNASGTISVSKIGNKGSTTSNLGQGTMLRFYTSGGRLLYTGTGETSDRMIQMENNMTLDHSGTGELNFSSAFNVLGNTKTLTLLGSSSGIGEISGIVSNGSATTSLNKDGTGTWRLSAANSFAGSTTVRNGSLILTGADGAIASSSSYTVNFGATLRLDNTADTNHGNRLRDASSVTLNGGTLHLANDGGDASYSETAAALSIAQNACTVQADRAPAGRTSTLTFSSLSRTSGATVNFVGEGLGDPDGRNKIVFTTAPTLVNGVMGPWATVNGTNLATYSASLGVYASSEPAYDADIAARGPSSVITSNSTSNVRINTEGEAGAIQLGSPVTRVASLTQNTAVDASVDTAGKTFQTAAVTVPAGKASVTLGAAAGDGTLSALTSGGDLTLASDAASGGLTVNAVIANNSAASTLTKLGSGTVTLTAPNTFSGYTSIGDGTLLLKNGDALQSSTLGGAGTVFDESVSGHAFTVGGLTGSFPLTLEDNAGSPNAVSLTVGKNNTTVTYGGVLSGSGSLTKIGTATQTLSGSNTLSGGITISQGAVTATTYGSLGTAPVINNSTLNLTGGGLNYTGLSSGLSGTGTVNVSVSTYSGNTTYLQGDYSGFTGIWNIGINAAANAGKAYMTGLDNSDATINVLSNAALYCNNVGTHTAKLVLKGGNTGEPYGQLRLENNCVWAGPITLAGPITSGEDGTVGASSGTGFITGNIGDQDSIPRPFYKIGAGTIALTGNNTFKGQTWIRNGTLRINSITNVGFASALGAPETVANGTIKFGENNTNTVLTYFGMGDVSDRKIELAGTTGSATIDHSGTNLLKLTSELIVSAAGKKRLTLQGSLASGSGEFAGVIADGASATVSVVKAGSGTWTLSGANSFSGGLTNSGGGTLVVAHPTAMGTGAVVDNNGVATFDLAHDGVGETVNDWLLYSGSVCTIRSNRGTEGDGINHTLGNMKMSGVTLHVTNGTNVTGGYPSITINSIDLFAGGATVTTVVNPTTADLFIGSVAMLESNFANKTLQLDGTSTRSAVTGPISNGLNTVLLTKANTGTWTLYGSNTYSGATAVNNGRLVVTGTDGAILGTGGITINPGATLRLEKNAVTNHGNRLSNTGTLTMKGGVLDYAHTGGAADYSETAGQLAVNSGSNTLLTARADESQTSTLTFSSLTHTGSGTINFAGEGLGNADNRNRVLFTAAPALPNGMIGPWAVINGTELATYDSEQGVIAYTAYSDLAAKGPDSVITNDATLNARINQPGNDGHITLETSPVSQVYTLLQNTETPAVVTTTDTLFKASAILLGAGKANLTIGAAQGDGALSALGSELLLANHDETSLLTVNAPITNNGAAVSLAKSGVGTVVLTGSNTYSGATAINGGTLAFGGTVTQTVTSVISGPGKLANNGTNRVTLAGANTYLGETTINAGVVVAQNNTAFGSAAGGTFIADGATLDIGGALSASSLYLGLETFTVSGKGVNELGAIVNASPTAQMNAINRVTLVGDTTVGAVGRWDIRNNSPILTLNGHTLTKIGANEFVLIAKVIPDGGHIVVTQGLMRVESSCNLNGDANDTLRVNSGARLDIYNLASGTNNSPWTLICDPLALVTAGSGYHPLNTWWGPVTLNGTTFLDGSSGRSMGFTNDVSGSGSLVKNGTGDAFLFSGNNTYAGTTSISNGLLHVLYPGGLPGYDAAGRVIMGPSGTLVTYYGEDGAGWTKEQIDAVRTNATFATASACLGINTAWGDLLYDRDLTDPMSFAKYGTNSLTLPGKNLFGGTLRVYGGTLNLPATSTNAIGTVYVNGGTLGGNLNIDGFTSLSQGTANMWVGSGGYDRSVVTFSTNAAMAKLLVGTTKGGSGAVIQNGGDLVVGAHIISTDVLSLGSSGGYGYYRMNAGSLITGQLGLTGGGSGNNDGVFDLYEGSVGVVTNGHLIWGWTGGNGVFNVFNGSLASPSNGNELVFAYAASRDTFSMLNLLGPAAYVDATGYNTGKSINMARNAGNIAGVLNLNAGTLLVNRVYAGVTGTPSLFNFNGGTLRANTARTDFMQGLTAATVYPGGAVIDTTNVNVTLNQPLLAPVGYGVTAVPLRSRGLGYIGAPTVMISGGSGTGATGIATVDLNETSPTFRQVTGITVTSPGSGYQLGDTVTVTLRGGGFTNNASALAEGATLGLNTSGGLTKLGSGTLTLGGVNTYGGATVISNGTVKLGNAMALPSGTEVVLAGGTLDLSGYTVTNAISAISGTLANGTLYTELSPAGTNVVGTETLALTGVTLQGKYLADVTQGGAADHVTFQGTVDLSGIELEIVDTEALNRKSVYTLATVTGTLAGGFAPGSLQNLERRWHLFYGADGSVKLLFVEGTVMLLR